jgi:hypothetical protein
MSTTKPIIFQFNKSQLVAFLPWVKQHFQEHPNLDCNVISIILEQICFPTTPIVSVLRKNTELLRELLLSQNNKYSDYDLTSAFDMACCLCYTDIIYIFRDERKIDLNRLDFSQCRGIRSSLTARGLFETDILLYKWIYHSNWFVFNQYGSFDNARRITGGRIYGF